MKIAMIDCETTGLDHTKHEIVEFGAVLFDDQTMKVEETYSFKIKPQHIETADPRALVVNGYNYTAWEGAITLDEFTTWAKARLVGYNFCSFPVLFDYGFLQAAGLGEIFDRHKICLFTMAWLKTGRILNLRDYCRAYGVPPEPAVHRAINGAQCGYELFKKLIR